MSDPMLGMALIVVFACGAQVIAALTGLPQIVPLLVAGVLGGPELLNLFDPDLLLEDTLDPFVSLAVGIVLFDGAMQLRREDLGHGLWKPVARLVSLGVVVSWTIITVAVHLLLDVTWGMSLLCGAILTLSGPTVVAPLLHHIRPTKRVGTVLEWEGILVDPIGAILAVLVFEALVSGNGSLHLAEFLVTVGVGAACGLGGALLAGGLLRLRRVPITTRTTATLAIVLLVVAGADAIEDDAGLVAAITVGTFVAAQEGLMTARERHEFSAFGAPLVGLLIGILFVILSARVDLGDVWALGWGAIVLLAVLFFVQRPLAVAIATTRTALTRRERLFAAGLMPRGIVVASTASAFALSLEDANVTDAHLLVPICFLVIAATVVVYGLGGRPLAKRLGVAGGDADEAPPDVGDDGSAGEVREAVERAGYGEAERP